MREVMLMEIIRHDWLSNVSAGSIIWDQRNGDLLKVLFVNVEAAEVGAEIVFSVSPSKTQKIFKQDEVMFLSDLNELFRRLSPEMRAAIGLLMTDVTGIKIALQQLFKSLDEDQNHIKKSNGGILY